MEFDLEFAKHTFFVALTGIPTTLKLTIVSLLLAVPIAFFMAVAKINQVRGIRSGVAIYVSFIRGTPIVLQILIIYSLFPSVLNLIVKQLELPLNVFDLNPIIYAYIVFTLNTIATMSEALRSALLTVDSGQLEAAQAIGLSTARAYTRIIIPQALVAALPNICNITVNLLKNTSLAFLMTVKDITAIAKMEASYGYNYIEAYAVIFLIYIIICTLVQFAFHLMERYYSFFKTYGNA